MRFAVASSALFAVMASAVTVTVDSTSIDTITSCGPEVTNCPARMSSTAAPVSVPASSSPAAAVPASSSPVAAVSAAPSAPAGGAETVTVTVTVSDCGASGVPAYGSGSPSAPAQGTNTAYLTETLSNGATTTLSIAAPYPTGANGTSPYKPTGTGAGSQGTGTSSGYGSTFTGAASHLNAGAALAGVGAIAAFLL